MRKIKVFGRVLSGILAIAGGVIAIGGIYLLAEGLSGKVGDKIDLSAYVAGFGAFVIVGGGLLCLPLVGVLQGRRNAEPDRIAIINRDVRRGLVTGTVMTLILLVFFVPFLTCPNCGGYGARYQPGSAGKVSTYEKCVLCGGRGVVTGLRKWQHRHDPPVDRWGMPENQPR
jgi:hypothetical protein